MPDSLRSGFQDEIQAAGASALLRSKSFAAATGVSDEDRKAERSAIRKAANPAAAERVAIRFGRLVEAWKAEHGGRSPGVDDSQIWECLTEITRQEIEGAGR